MAVYKDRRFSSTAGWVGGTRSLVRGPDLPDLDVATPVELGGRDTGVWSPEELLLAACASCCELTVVGAAHAHDVPLYAAEITATGHVTRRDDGRVGFIVIEIDARLCTHEDRAEDVGLIAERAKDACIVMLALDVPVHIRLAVTPLEPQGATALARM